MSDQPRPNLTGFRSEALRELARRAADAGWRWRDGGRHGAGHLLFYPPDRSLPPIALSRTAYDGSATRNLTAMFRRAGLDTEGLK